MKDEGLGLIKGGNQEIFKAVEIHHEDIDEALFDLDWFSTLNHNNI